LPLHPRPEGRGFSAEGDKNISVDDNYFGNGFDYKDKLLILTEDFKGLIPLNYK